MKAVCTRKIIQGTKPCHPKYKLEHCEMWQTFYIVIWCKKELKRFLCLKIYDGFEKVFLLRRIWEGFYWCRTYTPFKKELRRYFHWEESEKVSTDVHRTNTPFKKELRRYFHLRRLNIFQHSDLRRHWEGFPSEKDLRSMEILQNSWDGFEKGEASEKEMYPPTF